MREILIPILILLVHLAGCAVDGAGQGEAEVADTGAVRSQPFEGRVYERRIMFVAARRDSVVVIPLFLTARTSRERVDREIKAWLAVGGTWDPFFDAAWHTPLTRTPWRILPHRGLRIVVGAEDALERILYREGARNLEIVFDATLAEWSGQRGEWYRVQRASAQVAGQRFPGVLVDLTRGRGADDAPPGDWIFLLAGDTLQLLLEDPDASERSDSTYRAWARVGSDDYGWPVVRVTWSRARAFERARRDVPVSWQIVSEDGALEGTLEASGSHLVAGEGSGPLLPVQGFFEVRGSVRIGAARADVLGLVRHLQY